MKPAWIGLGSNLGQPRLNLQRGVAMMADLPDTRVAAISPAYWTPPWGVSDQPDYLNAVVRLQTDLPPPSLLAALLAIEHKLGRRRGGERWAPRELDLDLLVYDEVVMNDPGLTLPHPRLQQRAFVLAPLNDLSPDLEVPGVGRVSDLLAALPDEERAGPRRADQPGEAEWMNDKREAT